MAEKFEEVIAPAEKPNVPARGIEALATAGRRLGQLGNERAAAIRQGSEAVSRGLEGLDRGFQEVAKIREQHDETQDITHGYATITGIQNSISQQYKQFNATADKNDPNALQNFQDQVVVPAIEQWQDAFQTPGGKRWAAAHGGSVIEHFNNIALQDQATQAGVAAQSNLNAAGDNAMASVLADPRNLPLALDQVASAHNAIADANPSLTHAQSEHIRTTSVQAQQRELVVAGVKGLIDANPGTPPDAFIKTYADRGLLTPKDVESLHGYHKVARAVAETDKASQASRDADIADAASNQATGDHANILTAPTAPPAAFGQSVLNNQNMTPEAKANTLKAYKTVATGADAPVSNPQDLDGLISDLAGTDVKDRNSKIMGALGSGSISKADADWLIKQDPYSLAVANSNLQAGRTSILQPDPGSGVTNPARIAAYSRFQRAVIGGQVTDEDYANGFLRFRPSHDDALQGTSPALVSGLPAPGERKPLHEILWGPQ